ncbi:MAG: LysR family transcriptional regulator [Novosphingobium sp.]
MRLGHMLDLRRLRHLVALSRRLSYVRAAEDLGITQPTLTRSIQALERELQVRLFDRDRGRVSLTPQGRQTADRAAILLADAEALEASARASGRGESGRIRFGLAPMPASALLPQVLADRLARTPEVITEVVVRDVEALWAMLVAGEIEFFVSPNPPLHELSQVRAEVLGTFPLSLIVRAGHPLLAGDGGGPYPLLRSSWTGISIPEGISMHVLDRPNVIEDFGALGRLTETTDSIWLASAYAIPEQIAAGVLVELLRAPLGVDVVAYSLRRRTRSPLARSAIKGFEAQVRELCRRGGLTRAAGDPAAQA